MKAIKIGSFVSHLAGDLNHLKRELKTYGSDPVNVSQSEFVDAEREQRIQQSLERVEKAEQLLNICASLLLNPELLAQAETEVDTPNPTEGWENLLRFYQVHLEH
ncbi:MAG: hypothetical protein KBD66_03465 [Candidatus Doudnabacteria bacterium]|nr:hypothetical protein [Candidatus Doudnabacteria bacterium]